MMLAERGDPWGEIKRDPAQSLSIFPGPVASGGGQPESIPVGLTTASLRSTPRQTPPVLPIKAES